MTETRANTKKLFIKTYGCQMNVYDSDRMMDALAPHGYETTLDELIDLPTAGEAVEADNGYATRGGELRDAEVRLGLKFLEARIEMGCV